METCDPSNAVNNAEEQTLKATPQESVMENAGETPAGIVTESDPEAAAGDEMTAAESNQLKADTEVSVQSLLERLEELAQKPVADVSGDELRRIRQLYLSLHKADVEAARLAWEAEGHDPKEFEEPSGEADVAVNTLLNTLKERKTAAAAEREREMAENLEKKNEIIAEISALAEDTDNVNRTFPRYRELQDQFNALGEVAPTEETSVWKRFQEARERYSDNLKINKELRDYDFKKNLDSKQLLLDEAESLLSEEDVITAYRRLQELHDKWRQIGPVAKEIREEIWDKFKTASAEVNKRYQAYFEARKAREAENETAKSALCELVEAIDTAALTSFKAWDEATAKIIAAQADWKKLGFAPRKTNNRLFARFRAVCDGFFAAKAEFFKATHETLAKNLEAKNALVAKAEALKDSTEWRKTTEEIVALQKEWRTIGAVAKKHSDVVWRRFQQACDYFFEQKKKAGSGQRQTEAANLKAKREIIDNLAAIDTSNPEEAIARLKELQDAWQQTGHVPFKEKDKIYDAYRAKVNELRDALDLSGARSRMERFHSNVAEIEGDDNKLYRERERLLRTAELRRNELRTYENNLGFFSSKSKSGDSMVKDFMRRIDRIKAELDEIAEKVKLIDSKL